MAETKEFTFEITRHIGVVSENEQSGWKRELNFVSWNERPAKLDLRDWNPEHSKAGKGITLTDEEAKRLLDLLAEEF